MSSRIGGLIPLLLRKSTVLPALRTLAEIGLFYLGLELPRYFSLAPWQLFLLSVAIGGISALAIARQENLRGQPGDLAAWETVIVHPLCPTVHFGLVAFSLG